MQSKDEASRRSFLSQTAATIAFVGAGGLTGNGLMIPIDVANAATTGAKKVNAALKAYGLPQVAGVPDGLTPLLEIYGKGKNRFPILVGFNYPLTWIVTTPSNDVNGEDGTIQAGEYAKGDTATFYVYEEPGHVSNLHSQPKELFEKALMKSIGQKGDNMYQNFKVRYIW